MFSQRRTELPRTFASDNYAGAHPDVLTAVALANRGHAAAYGDDAWTAHAQRLLSARFGETANAWLVQNGTAANVLALGAVTKPWEAVIVADTAHLHTAEAGAPERLAAVKLLPVATTDGKLACADVERALERLRDGHAAPARVVSLTNASELGTVYTVDETRALADLAHRHAMLLHVDGARLANAAVALDVELAELVTEAGADVVSFGMTKVGALGVDAIVFPRGPAPDGFNLLRRQHAQLPSKMRFLAAQAIALLEGDLWRRTAGHANAMASLLGRRLEDVPGVRVSRPVQTNAVFATVDAAIAEATRKRCPFSIWDPLTGEVRWMCAWDTTTQDVDDFVAALRATAEPPIRSL